MVARLAGRRLEASARGDRARQPARGRPRLRLAHAHGARRRARGVRRAAERDRRAGTHPDGGRARPSPVRDRAPCGGRCEDSGAPPAAKVLGAAQRALYGQVYPPRVRGEAHVPRDRNFLVVANHASHLDMGLVKVALGDEGEKLSALAAADYFFDTPLKRAYFENFTNLIPMEREGSVRRGLRTAVEALRRGRHVLVFPEGTRSRDGTMAEFRATAGYLAL